MGWRGEGIVCMFQYSSPSLDPVEILNPRLSADDHPHALFVLIICVACCPRFIYALGTAIIYRFPMLPDKKKRISNQESGSGCRA